MLITKNTKTTTLDHLYGIWPRGKTGLSYLRKIRYGKKDKEREEYLRQKYAETIKEKK